MFWDYWDGDSRRLKKTRSMKTTRVKNLGDGQWKTTTLVVSDASFQNRQRGGMDFRIVNAAKHGLTARCVRVVRLTPPPSQTNLEVHPLQPVKSD
jgi:hypothetical protein